MAVLTTKLNNGTEVTAKMYYGEPVAKHYANRTGAERAVAKLGSGWHVYRGMSRVCFYAARMPLVEPTAESLAFEAMFDEGK